MPVSREKAAFFWFICYQHSALSLLTEAASYKSNSKTGAVRLLAVYIANVQEPRDSWLASQVYSWCVIIFLCAGEMGRIAAGQVVLLTGVLVAALVSSEQANGWPL